MVSIRERRLLLSAFKCWPQCLPWEPRPAQRMPNQNSDASSAHKRNHRVKKKKGPSSSYKFGLFVCPKSTGAPRLKDVPVDSCCLHRKISSLWRFKCNIYSQNPLTMLGTAAPRTQQLTTPFKKSFLSCLHTLFCCLFSIGCVKHTGTMSSSACVLK